VAMLERVDTDAEDAFTCNSELPALNDFTDSLDARTPTAVVAGRAEAAESTLPSVGSKLHAEGKCRPCGWFWKPEGCKNGARCHHCHLCPQDAIKNRKKAKALALSQAQSRPSEAAPEIQKPNCAAPPEGDWQTYVQVPVEEESSLTSVGAALHSTGQCRPCAWFHKPGGCKNGKACLHCHSCHQDEMRIRKREKIHALQLQDVPAKAEVATAEARVDATLQATTLLPSRGSVWHHQGVCKPCSWIFRPEGCKNGFGCHCCHLCGKDAVVAHKRAQKARFYKELTRSSGIAAAEQDHRA
jgi:hypothetical protein